MVDKTRAHLRRIEKLATDISQLAAEQDFAVSRARAAGASWAEIANALGCSPQAAHKRYRWVGHSERTREVWHERPLPNMRPTPRRTQSSTESTVIHPSPQAPHPQLLQQF